MTAVGRRALLGVVTAGLLAALAVPSAGWAAGPAPVRVHQNVPYGTSAQGLPLDADVYTPAAEAEPAAVVILVHGGGFTSGDKVSDAQYAAALAAVGFVAVNVDYTLAAPGKRGYPEQVREIQRAIRWSIAHARQFGGDPHRLALVGFSAGGYLAAMAGLLDSGLPGRPVRAVITLSAPLDIPAVYRELRARIAACGYRPSCPKLPHSPSLSAFATLFDFLGCTRGKCPVKLIKDASPSEHVTATAPAFLIFNSAHELVPRSQATDMGKVLRAAGIPEKVVIVPGSQHGQSYVPKVSLAILNFLRRELGNPRLQLAASSAPARSPGTAVPLLVACCALVAAGSIGIVLLAARKRVAGTGDGAAR